VAVAVDGPEATGVAAGGPADDAASVRTPEPITRFVTLEGRFAGFREPGAWLIAALLLGALPRLFLVYSSEGTLDAIVWAALIDEVQERGLIATYRGGAYTLNHPPVAVLLASGLRELGVVIGLPFAVVFRLPFALLDVATFALIVWLFGAATDPRWKNARYLAAVAWWLSPLAIIFSSHHGNTDSAVAFFLVAAAGSVARGRPGMAGAMLALGLWIKIPGVLAAPLLWLAVPDRPGRIRFAVTAVGLSLVGYLPWLWLDAETVIRSVFLYPGLRIQTTAGMPIWGLERFLPDWRTISPEWRADYRSLLVGWLRANTLVCVVPIVALAIVRRRRHDAVVIASGVAGTFAILYGLSNLWSFQYLAWSMPFWIALGWRWFAAATLLTTTYVYGLYAWLCGSWLLVGEWAFIAQPDWPLAIRLARDACVLFFAGTALQQIIAASREERARWRSGASVG
jgi:hypothetical protein